MFQKKSRRSKGGTSFDDLSNNDKLLLIKWADDLDECEMPKDMDERIRARLRIELNDDTLLRGDYTPTDKPLASKDIPPDNHKSKSCHKKSYKIIIIAATITLILSIGLSAGMIDFNSLYVAKESKLMSLSGEKNVYGQQYTPDIYDQYATLAKEIGSNFFVPMYVPDGYVLESIKTGQKTKYVIFTFAKEDTMFTIRQAVLRSEKDETLNILTEGNLVEEETFDWGDSQATLYKSTLEQGDIVYSIMYNYSNINLKLVGTLSKEDTIKAFKLLVKYEGQ